jgi:hypothetical protein
VHKRKAGPADNDFTAYLESQREWGEDRENRPGILFVYKVLQRDWQGTEPQWLIYNDDGVSRVVIDVINHRPLKAFPNLPVNISKKVEGWLVEAWERQDKNINVEDLIQRMPFTANDDVWDNRNFSNALTQRKERFRNRGRCLSWKMVKHDRVWDRKLAADVHANIACTKGNTTRYLHDLTKEVDDDLGAVTWMTGKHTRRAGARELKGEARTQKEIKMRRKCMKSQKSDMVESTSVRDLSMPGQYPGSLSRETLASGRNPQIQPSRPVPHATYTNEAEPQMSADGNTGLQYGHTSPHTRTIPAYTAEIIAEELGTQTTNQVQQIGVNGRCNGISSSGHESVPAPKFSAMPGYPQPTQHQSEPTFPNQGPSSLQQIGASFELGADFFKGLDMSTPLAEAHPSLDYSEATVTDMSLQDGGKFNTTQVGLSLENHQSEPTNRSSKQKPWDESHDAPLQSDIAGDGYFGHAFPTVGPSGPLSAVDTPGLTLSTETEADWQDELQKAAELGLLRFPDFELAAGFEKAFQEVANMNYLGSEPWNEALQ